MHTTLTANQLSGRATGSLFFVGFGALWLILAFYVRQSLSAITICAVTTGTLLLLAGSSALFRHARRFPRVPDDPAIGRAFGRINAVQWIAVFVLAFSFARLHIDAYVLSAITAIIGLHMFPLARLFRYPMHHITGAVLVGWAAVSIFVAPAGHLQGVTALGTGIILWLSSAATLALAYRVALSSQRDLVA
jgi:hypothetical protein